MVVMIEAMGGCFILPYPRSLVKEDATPAKQILWNRALSRASLRILLTPP